MNRSCRQQRGEDGNAVQLEKLDFHQCSKHRGQCSNLNSNHGLETRQTVSVSNIGWENMLARELTIVSSAGAITSPNGIPLILIFTKLKWNLGRYRIFIEVGII